MIYYLLLDRKERYPSYEDEDLPPRNDVGQSLGGRRDPLKGGSCFSQLQLLRSSSTTACESGAIRRYSCFKRYQVLDEIFCSHSR